MSDPEVDAFNVRVGTQTFSGLYQFTTNSLLVETALAIREMGSDILKFYAGPEYERQNKVTLPAGVTDLPSLARLEPSFRKVMELPFRHYLIWSYSFTAGWWQDGYSATESQKEYAEMYAFARHFLTNYSGTGKRFYLGHWEGDWHLLGGYDATKNPSPTAIAGMRAWLNNRQRAVDDARRDTPHQDVEVYLYTEVNRVRDAMVGSTNVNQRVVNTVLPYVTNLDYVSWSSYDGQDLSRALLRSTLDYIESNLPTNKAATISGKRVFVGEYGWGGAYPVTGQELLTRTYLRNLIEWGTPFALFWEIYNNEPNRNFCLIDSAGKKTPCYYLHQRYANRARLEVARFKQEHGRLPTEAEYASLALSILRMTQPVPVSLAVTNLAAVSITANRADLEGSLAQGIYGEPWARVFLAWGKTDGQTNSVAWENVNVVATNGTFGPATFRLVLTNLSVDTTYYYRFWATNGVATGWAGETASFRTPPVDPRVMIQGSPQGVVLSWPLWMGSNAVETTSQFDGVSAWSPLAESGVPQGDTLELALPASQPVQFFRLHRQ